MKARNLVEWRTKVLERDNHICQKCGMNNRRLIAHHRKAVDQYPELILEIENGITFCYHCHGLMPMQLKLFRVDTDYEKGYWYPERVLKLARSRFQNRPIW